VRIILCANHPLCESSCARIIHCANHPQALCESCAKKQQLRESSCARIIRCANHPVTEYGIDFQHPHLRTLPDICADNIRNSCRILHVRTSAHPHFTVGRHVLVITVSQKTENAIR